MTDSQQLKRRIVHTFQRLVLNPVGRQMPLTMLETTGRKSGQPRRTAIGGRVMQDDDAQERLQSLPGINSTLVRLTGSDLLTIRVDLD